MKIACLAWGSLLWKWEPLKLESGWKEDGPVLPVEFARVGDGGELSTALCPGASDQQVWWCELQEGDLAKACELLREREQIDPSHPEWIGSLPATATQFSGLGVVQIREWLSRTTFDAVIWTALPPRFNGVEHNCPSADEALDYLQGLHGKIGEHAKDYIRRVPARMNTEIRRHVVKALGWTTLDS